MEVQKSAGCSELISSYKEFINSAKSVDITSLREIIHITSDMIKARECSRTPIPSEKELDDFFIFIPNVLDRDSKSDTSTDLFDNTSLDQSKLHDQSEIQEKFMEDLKLEIDSLCLDKRKSNKPKVVTQWILPDPSASPNLTNVERLENFSCISRLCDIVNSLDETAGTMVGALVNYYPTGGARSNPHSDDESYVDQSASIATFSLGSERVFNIFNKDHGSKQILRSFVLTEKSLMIMQPGSQAVTRHMVASSSLHSGPRWSISFRKIIPSNITNEWPHNNNNTKQKARNHQDTQDHTTLILGTSISRGLVGHKLAGKSGQNVINLSKGGAKINHLSEILDQFFSGKHEYLDRNTMPPITSVKRVFVSVGTNDIRFAKDGINHLYSPMQNLLEKIKLYYPNATVYVQSLLPQRVESEHTVKNVLNFNKLLIKVCTITKSMFLDIFKNFLLFLNNKKFLKISRNMLKHVPEHRFILPRWGTLKLYRTWCLGTVIHTNNKRKV